MNIPDGITHRGCTPTENQCSHFLKNKKSLEQKCNLNICDTDNCNNLLMTFDEEKATKEHLELSIKKLKIRTQSNVSKKKRIVSKCYQCDTAKNDNCTSNVQENLIAECSSDLDNFGCYHIINGKFH